MTTPASARGAFDVLNLAILVDVLDRVTEVAFGTLAGVVADDEAAMVSRKLCDGWMLTYYAP